MKRQQTFRQGDILLVRVAAGVSFSGRSVSPEGGRLILARGEVTGHQHSVASADAELVESEAEGVFLRIMAATPLVHQEHGAIVLEPGVYRVQRQREYEPGELPRNVAD
jgi:hypothetical protein